MSRQSGFASWVARRYVSREVGDRGGHLFWVGSDGRVVDLGPYARADLLTLAWAWRVAYRHARDDRESRSRLARSRDAVARLGRVASQVDD